MSDILKGNNPSEKPISYGAIGLSVFLIFFGASYLIPNAFPEGSLFIVAGILFLLINLVKTVKNIGYDGFEILIGVALLVSGLNKVLMWDISFIPVIIMGLAVFYLIKSINNLRK